MKRFKYLKHNITVNIIQLAEHCLCGVPTGIRTPVAAVKGRCPRPLDDGDPDLVSGGARRDRTADLYNAIVALSQLSYSPEGRVS